MVFALFILWNMNEIRTIAFFIFPIQTLSKMNAILILSTQVIRYK